MQSRKSLSRVLQSEIGDYRTIMVSNREPYIQTFSEDGISWVMPPGGLTAALDPIMVALGGTWIASASGDTDGEIVGRDNKIAVPPHDPHYFLRRVWLSEEDEEGYYSGFSNKALWPLCHTAYVRPEFNEDHWEAYQRVNRRFADYVCEEIAGHKAFVFVQDYHLALLPRLIKERNPNVITAQFWHIPWPNSETFRICPWYEEIIEGLLGNDLLGFHTEEYCDNFLDTADQATEARIDYHRSEIVRHRSRTRVRPFPISVDFEQIAQEAQQPIVDEEMDFLKKKLGLEGKLVGMGLDRLDYTKGIPERLEAIDQFLTRFPEYLEQLVFIQVASSSRSSIEEYQQLTEEVESKIEEINARYGSESWTPIIQLGEELSATSLLALRRLAHFCIVSSLHDGMNLVAKEYVASRFDGDGVLILSPFTGAAQELDDALLVNPYDTRLFAETIKRALKMSEQERRSRMRRMRRVVQENNIYDWAVDIISEIMNLSPLEE